MTSIDIIAKSKFQADLFGNVDLAHEGPLPRRGRIQRRNGAKVRSRRQSQAPGTIAVPLSPLDQSRLDTLILARILSEPRGIDRGDVARDLAPLVAPWLDADAWRTRLDRTLMSIADAGLISYRNGHAAMTDAGRMRASLLIDAKGAVPKSWAQMRNARIMALALGRSEMSAARQVLLAKPDGLRATIVETAFGLKLRGSPTPTRLRTALAAFALARAFGGTASAQTSPGRQGLSPRAGRALAGQLFSVPRDPKTDKRLVADLAADVLTLQTADFATLQVSLLQRYLSGVGKPMPPTPIVSVDVKAKSPAARHARSVAKVEAPHTVPRAKQSATSVPQLAARQRGAPRQSAADIERPDLEKFVSGVLTAARSIAEGWAGSRKAFISRVSDVVRQSHPRWGLADVEFKAMLAEAHRLGRIVLATVDLRTAQNLKDVQASQVTFKNTHFHLIRVEG